MSIELRNEVDGAVTVSYRSQYITPHLGGTVQELFYAALIPPYPLQSALVSIIDTAGEPHLSS
ncbi:MAG: hypothetical protein L0Z54_05360 [Thermoplasmata archaeon]|nr:hypothetical protein [Thermoplasmata archaeon]